MILNSHTFVRGVNVKDRMIKLKNLPKFKFVKPAPMSPAFEKYLEELTDKMYKHISISHNLFLTGKGAIHMTEEGGEIVVKEVDLYER